MRRHHPENERIKREYFNYLEQAKRMSQTSVDQIAAAIAQFEQSTNFKDFRRFHIAAFSRRKTRAKLRRARSGEFAARNSMSGGCYSEQVYRGRASGFQGAEPTGLPPHSTHWCRHGLAEPEPPIKGLALRFAGLWVVRASSPAPRTNGA